MEASSPDADRPTVLVGAGRRDHDAGAIWTALLEVARGSDEAAARRPDLGAGRTRDPLGLDRSASAPVAFAESGVEASSKRMRDLLATGHDRLVVVPLDAVDERADPPGWQAPLAAVVDDLRRTHPTAEIYDLGRPAVAGPAAALAEVVAVTHHATPALLAGAIARAFDADPGRLSRFVAAIREALPPATTIALRGSAVVGRSFTNGTPFDGDGPRTSDLDLVALGDDVMDLWVPEARLAGGINTLPLCDGTAWVAPRLDAARRAAQAIVHRPVSVQAMAGWFLDLRAVVQGQPYVILDARP